MKLLNLVTFSALLILTLSGCIATSPRPSKTPVMDDTLPVITLTSSGVFVDMKEVGFEWESITDPRVKGIYVYKHDMSIKDDDYRFYESINNRFATHYIDNNVKPQSNYAYYFKTYTDKSESKQSKQIPVTTLALLDSVSWIHVLQDMPKSAKIIWRPHTNKLVKKYIVERKTLKDDEWKELKRITGRLNAEYIDTNLKDNFVYKYRIKVLTYNNIISKPSEEVKVVTKPLPQGIETVLATRNLAKKIKVSWNAVSTKDFAHYNIYKASSVDGRYKLIKRSKNTEFIDHSKEDNQDYFYRVSVVDKDGLQSKYNAISAHGKTLSKPLKPSLVEVAMRGENLEITWSCDDSRVKSYIVNKTIKKGWLDSKSAEFLNIKGTKFVDKSIEANTTYYYEVYSLDEFSIKSKPSMEVKYKTSKNQGSMLAPIKKEVNQASQNSSSPSDSKNVIQPMDDFDVSAL